MYFNFAQDPVNSIASPVFRPGWSGPVKGWLGKLIPAAAAVDPTPIPTFEIKFRNKILKPDFVILASPGRVGRESSCFPGDLGAKR